MVWSIDIVKGVLLLEKGSLQFWFSRWDILDLANTAEEASDKCEIKVGITNMYVSTLTRWQPEIYTSFQNVPRVVVFTYGE